jgi:hypothetical protein
VTGTQDAIYAELDLDLSWTEHELPERERTKHVHRLHPYLGKFIPQLVEELLRRHVPAGGRVLDPFAGSGTTLVRPSSCSHSGRSSPTTSTPTCPGWCSPVPPKQSVAMGLS